MLWPRITSEASELCCVVLLLCSPLQSVAAATAAATLPLVADFDSSSPTSKRHGQARRLRHTDWQERLWRREGVEGYTRAVQPPIYKGDVEPRAVKELTENESRKVPMTSNITGARQMSDDMPSLASMVKQSMMVEPLSTSRATSGSHANARKGGAMELQAYDHYVPDAGVHRISKLSMAVAIGICVLWAISFAGLQAKREWEYGQRKSRTGAQKLKKDEGKKRQSKRRHPKQAKADISITRMVSILRAWQEAQNWEVGEVVEEVDSGTSDATVSSVVGSMSGAYAPRAVEPQRT